MDLEQLQAETRRHMRGIEHPRLGAALAVAEEAGEVARCVLDREVYGKDVLPRLAEEVGDLLLALVEVCERYGFSLGTCAEGALAKLARQAPGWREELGEHLRGRRDALDA